MRKFAPVLFIAFLFTACAAGPDASGGAAFNSNCVMRGVPVDASVTTTFDGQTVGFCCKGCLGKFEKLSDAEKTMKVKSAN